MIETTTHCDYCGNPLGRKCDCTAASAVRAKISGTIVVSRFAGDVLDYGFFCSTECANKSRHKGELNGKKEIHKTQDEEKEGSS